MMTLAHPIFSFAVAITIALTSCATGQKPEIPTVNHVELDSYFGIWYEIRRIENRFQDNEPSRGDGPCFNTTAEYSALPKGKLGVKNSCYRKSGLEVAQANAKSVLGSNNSKLKVNFTGIALLEWLGIGNADYWILALGEKNSENRYSWVVVGSPGLDFGWILSRTPVLTVDSIEKALSAAESVGYDRQLFKSFQR